MRLVFLFLFVPLIFSNCSSEQKENEQNTVVTDAGLPKTISPILPVKMENIESRYPNGRLKVKGILKNGKREGQWISWYENGQEWSECIYENGLKNGATSSWHENGMRRYDGLYTKDVKTGKWMYWDDKGKLEKESDYSKETK